MRSAVSQRLRQDIVNGVLRPGSIVTDMELAARYGASTSPIREALAELTAERLIEMPSRAVKRVTQLYRKISQDLFEIFELLALRGYEKGAPLVDGEAVGRMEGALKEHERLAGRDGFAPSLLRDFHDPVFVAAGNRELRRQLGLSYPWLERLVTLLRRDRPQRNAGARARAILTAFKAKEPGQAVQLFGEAVAMLGKQIDSMPDIS